MKISNEQTGIATTRVIAGREQNNSSKIVTKLSELRSRPTA
jgi:hypothetical protein